MSAPLVSVVVNNHDYERFVGEAIESALGQTQPRTEVVVVDDGSTDRSREAIAGFGDRVVAVLKENGGQASALAAGLRAAGGEVLCFLDADDTLLPEAMEQAVAELEHSGAVCVHWPLWEVYRGRRTGQLRPREPLPAGDRLDALLAEGPDSQAHPPTSGSAWRRDFLERVFPIPGLERELGIGSASADAYLAALAPLYGPIGSLGEPRGTYRLHDESDYTALPFSDRLRRDLATFRQRCAAVVEHSRALGIDVDPDRWTAASWVGRLEVAVDEIEENVPAGDSFVLIDDAEWGMEATGDRPAVPFLERGGEYWGRPADDAAAVRELERLRSAGASFAVVAWPAFWWLDHYPALSASCGNRRASSAAVTAASNWRWL